jgi:hypothetical protein
MRATKLAILAGLMPAFAQAADWGLGTTVGESDTTIYVPVQVSEGFRLEPFAGYYRNEFDSDSGTFGLSGYSVGSGFFRTVPFGERAQAYFGARLSYSYSKYRNVSADETGQGYRVAPVLGGEIFLLPQLSVGVEAYAYYSDTDIDGDAFMDGNEEIGTASNFVARFHFR